MTKSDELLEVERCKARIKTYQVDPEYRDEYLGLRCCELALQAIESGSYGVGALLVDGKGEIILEACNSVFSGDHIHTAAHAEMNLIDQLEALDTKPIPDSLKLLVSLEPCPMCLTRILASGIGVVKYMAEDRAGGMLSNLGDMPPAWQNLAQTQSFYRAHISDDLRDLAHDLSQQGLSILREKLATARKADK